MVELLARLRQEAVYLGEGLVGVESFLNHQVDASLAERMGQELAARVAAWGLTRVVTPETGGLPVALALARALEVPLVYARRNPPRQPGPVLSASSISRSRGDRVTWSIAAAYLQPSDRVLLADDFISRGHTMLALSEMVKAAGAQLCGLACVLEKTFEGGRQRLEGLRVPILSLARLELEQDRLVVR